MICRMASLQMPSVTKPIGIESPVATIRRRMVCLRDSTSVPS